MVSVRDILFTLVIVNVDSRERMSDERSQIGDTRPPTGGRVYMKAQLFASASVAALFALPTTAMAQSSEAAAPADTTAQDGERRSEEHTSELQSLMRISYAV